MSIALAAVYVCLALVEVPLAVVWLRETRRQNWPYRPSRSDLAIGVVTCFLDTLGIGNYAQITPCSSCAVILLMS